MKLLILFFIQAILKYIIFYFQILFIQIIKYISLFLLINHHIY